VKAIAVEGCSFKYTITVATPNYSVQDPSGGQITAPPSPKVKAEGKGVYKNGCSFQATLIAPPTNVGGAVTPTDLTINGNFNSTAMNTKADGTLVLLKGDKTAAMTASFTDTNSASGVTVPVVVTVIAEIDDPGQEKVKAN